MFPGLRMTEEGWLRFQRVDQDEHNTVEQLKLFRAATRTLVRPNADSSSSADLPDGGGGGSLTFVEFVKLLLSPANRALDPAALLPEEGHADAPLTHFWIATSHNSYAVGHQLTGYADEAMYRRLLLQGCRSLEIDCWNGRRGEPVVTHGNTLVNKISFASVAKAVRETAFITSQAPVILSLEMHCGAKQQARIAELLKKELGALLLTADELEGLFEAQSPAAREIDGRGESARISARRLARHVGEHPSERALPLKALQGRVLVKSKLVPQRPRYEERPSTDDDDPQSPQTPQSGTKRGSKGVVDPNLSALITMVSIPAPRFMRGSLPSGVQGLPISSVSEPLLLSIFATAGEDLRAEAAAKVQRVTRGWQARSRTAPARAYQRGASRASRTCMSLRSRSSSPLLRAFPHRSRALLCRRVRSRAARASTQTTPTRSSSGAWACSRWRSTCRPTTRRRSCTTRSSRWAAAVATCSSRARCAPSLPRLGLRLGLGLKLL